MIDPASLFLSIKGRIGRFWYWVGALALFFLGDGAAAFFRSWFAADIQPQLIDLAVTVALVWPDFCVGRKRLADRGRSFGWALAYSGYGLVASLIVVFAPFLVEKPDGAWPTILFWACYTTAVLFFVVECGVRKGDDGTNVYGPAPTFP